MIQEALVTELSSLHVDDSFDISQSTAMNAMMIVTSDGDHDNE